MRIPTGLKRFLLGLLFTVVASLMVSEGHSSDAKGRALNVSLALGAGGLGDRAFNDSAYEGLQKANWNLGIRFRVTEFRGKEEQAANLIQLAQEQFDLIIALGFENGPPLKQAAERFPHLKFSVIDTVVDVSNVSSVVFREIEGDFLAGALCALMSGSGVLGFLGGADVPVIRRIENGWSQGIRHVNPKAVILSEFAGGVNDFSGFRKPDLGRQLAIKMYQAGADIVYSAAGGTDIGAIHAAQEKQRRVVTTGSDRRWMAPEVVITSRTKNVDAAVLTLLRELKSGAWRPGIKTLDLRSGGVSLAPLEHKQISTEMKEKISDLRQKLMEGKIRLKE